MSFTSPSVARPAWRDVYLAATARGISACGDYLAATALALTLQTRGDNGYGVAALLIASTLPLALLGPLAGRMADRLDSRRTLVVTGLIQAGVCTALAYTGQPVLMVALVALLSVGLAITQPTLTALVPDMVGREQLGRATAINQTGGAIGMLAGPALGGLLVGAYGVHLPLLLDAGSYLAIAIVGLMLRTRRGGRTSMEPAAAGGPSQTAVAAPAWRLRGDRLLVTLMTAFATVIAAVTAVNVAEIFFVRDTLGASTSVYGMVTGVWTLGVLIGAVPFGRLGGNDQRLVTVQLVILAGLSAVVLGSAGVPAAGWLLPLYLVGGLLNSGLNVLAGVVLSRRVPAAVRGRVFGTFSAVGNAASMIGYVLGGVLLQVVAPRPLIAGTGLVSLLVAAIFLAPLLRRRPDSADGSAALADPAVSYGEA